MYIIIGFEKIHCGNGKDSILVTTSKTDAEGSLVKVWVTPDYFEKSKFSILSPVKLLWSREQKRYTGILPVVDKPHETIDFPDLEKHFGKGE